MICEFALNVLLLDSEGPPRTIQLRQGISRQEAVSGNLNLTLLSTSLSSHPPFPLIPPFFKHFAS
jgi:hypothetical protein